VSDRLEAARYAAEQSAKKYEIRLYRLRIKLAAQFAAAVMDSTTEKGQFLDGVDRAIEIGFDAADKLIQAAGREPAQ
jgi:hypothetical protein